MMPRTTLVRVASKEGEVRIHLIRRPIRIEAATAGPRKYAPGLYASVACYRILSPRTRANDDRRIPRATRGTTSTPALAKFVNEGHGGPVSSPARADGNFITRPANVPRNPSLHAGFRLPIPREPAERNKMQIISRLAFY